jgi:aminopeptidase C
MAHYKKIMATVMSVPPDTFIFECETSEKTIKIGPVTPVQFYRDFCDIKLNEYICVVSNKNKPYNKVLRFPSNHQYNSAIVDVPHTDIFNVSHNRFVQLAKKSILENNATPFSCIVDTNISRLHCLMDLNIYNYNHLDLHFTEHYDRSAVNIHNIKTHAMVLCGVDINSNSKKISRWKVHNSWSDDTPYVMAHNWFLRNVIRIFIHIDILNKKERELYKLSKKDNECIIIKHNEQSALQ